MWQYNLFTQQERFKKNNKKKDILHDIIISATKNIFIIAR